MPVKTKKTRFIFFIYWFLLVYIIAALIFWFIALSRQNEKMTLYKTELLDTASPGYIQSLATIQNDKKRKEAQYAGEGAIFLLLIIAGAGFVYNSVKKQLLLSQQQHAFMIGVTHELKTPVAVAKLNMETLQKRKLDAEQQQKLMRNTLQEINRLDALCNNMLISSQMEAGVYHQLNEQVNLAEVCHKVVEDFRQRNNNRVVTKEIDNTLFVLGDEVLIMILLNNLVENAIKYSPKNTDVTVQLTRDNNCALIQVKDEGPGIIKEERKKVFDKFYRVGNEATRSARGTGIGLYLVQNLVKAHKGTVFITDNTGGGSIFNVELPLYHQ